MRGNRREFLAALSALTTIKSTLSSAADEFVTVDAPSGLVRGRAVDNLHVFTGIPFGASTAGAARFRPPRPATPWAGTFDATQPAKIPPQPTNFLFPKLPGVPSEDCLQLNIWAPQRPGRYPVLVWMYGGGNLQGSCVEPFFDCAPFARDGIVAVNFNYRLGALGFLELGSILGPEYRGSANNAMQDQLLALQWVKQNISAFGGDPEQITVAGQSAGAGNLIALLGVPASKGLMRRAIISSGTKGVTGTATAHAFAEVFMKQLGDVSRLRSASFDEILDAQGKALAAWSYELPFGATVDAPGLPAEPKESVAAGSARDLELMIGWCHDETRTLVSEAEAGDPAFVPRASAADAAKMRSLMDAYAKAHPELSPTERVWKSTSAGLFVLPCVRIADAQAVAGGKIQTYRLDYAVRGGPFGETTPHGFDITMAFEQMSSPVGKFFGFSAADTPMAKTMHAVWSSFIRTGTVAANLPAWPSYDLRTRRTMVLDRTPHVADDITRFEREVWAGA